MQSFKWTMESGANAEIRAEYSCKMEKELVTLDGWPVELSEAPEESAKLELYINGECVDTCTSSSSSWRLTDNSDVPGVKKILGLKAGLKKQELIDKYEAFIAQVIDEGTEEEIAQARKEKSEVNDAEQAEIEARMGKWSVVNYHAKQMPKGGEMGQDGYIDADYKNEVGEIIRMVSRDVFDFGCEHYPKRLEGERALLDKSAFNGAEYQLIIWLSEFSPFKRTRM